MSKSNVPFAIFDDLRLIFDSEKQIFEKTISAKILNFLSKFVFEKSHLVRAIANGRVVSRRELHYQLYIRPPKTIINTFQNRPPLF